MGKSFTRKPITEVNCYMSVGEQQIAEAELLIRLQRSPEVAPNFSNKARTAPASLIHGFMRRITSSAYNDSLCLMPHRLRGRKRPTDSAMANIADITSMMTMKSTGRGSPCHKPLACQNGSSTLPLINMRVLAVERSRKSRDIQRGTKPRLRSTSSRNELQTKSNAFDISSLSTELSEISLPPIKARWVSRIVVM